MKVKEIVSMAVSKALIRYQTDWALRVRPPRTVVVEASSLCNIHCLCCPVGQGKIEGALMPLSVFKSIVSGLPTYIRQIDFSHRGEPTTNPELPEMIHYASERGLATDVYTNGLFLDRQIDELVESRLTRIRVDLDGANSVSYSRYRVGSNFKRVKDNVRHLVLARASSQRKSPEQICLTCVVTAFNENEIDQIHEMAKELGVDEILFKTAYINYGTKFYNDESVQKAIAPRNRALRRPRRPARFLCPFLWRSTILHDGGMIMCTADFEGAYRIGNVLDDGGFENVFFGDRARTKRKEIIHLSGRLCRDCAVVGPDHYIRSISRRYGPASCASASRLREAR